MGRRSLAVLLFLGITATTIAGAQDEEVDPVKFTLDAGFANTAGNSDVSTISLGQTFIYTSGPWILSQTFDMLFNRTGDSTTAENYKGNVRGDRTFGRNDRLAVFLDLRASKDRFAGISRRFEEALGISYDVVKTGKDLVAVEGAATLVQERSILGVDNNYPAALAGARYRHNFTADATFGLVGEYIPNLENGNDYRLNGEARLIAPLSGSIALSLSYLVRFDNEPEPGFKKTDRFFTSGIQLTL